MIVDLARIGPVPKKISLILEPDSIELDGEGITLDGKIEFKGEAERFAGKPHIRGEIEADITLDCTRCLEPIARHLEIPFEDVFVGADDQASSDDNEIALDDLDESPAVEGKVNIAEIVREQILLAMPDQAYCREDCKGLCPKCGANRNLIDCNCADDDIDPRWAALKSLR